MYSFAVCTIIGTMGTSDCLFAGLQLHFRLYASSLQFSVQSRLSPVPTNTFLTCCYLYTAGFLGIAFRVLHTVYCLRRWCLGSTPCCSLSRMSITVRQYSLYVTTRQFVRSSQSIS